MEIIASTHTPEPMEVSTLWLRVIQSSEGKSADAQTSSPGTQDKKKAKGKSKGKGRQTKPTAKSGDIDFDENPQAAQEEPAEPQGNQRRDQSLRVLILPMISIPMINRVMLQCRQALHQRHGCPKVIDHFGQTRTLNLQDSSTTTAASELAAP